MCSNRQASPEALPTPHFPDLAGSRPGTLVFVRYDGVKYRFHFKMYAGHHVRSFHISLNGLVDLFGMIDYDTLAEVEKTFRHGEDVLLELFHFVSQDRTDSPNDSFYIGRGAVMRFEQRHCSRTGI